MKKKMRKGQMIEIGATVIALSFSFMLVIFVIQGRSFTEQIFSEEIRVMEARNSVFLAEKGMDTSWEFAGIQSLLRTGDMGVGVPQWYYLDNTKALTNNGQKVIEQSIIASETDGKRKLDPNPALLTENPIIFKPTAEGFALGFEYIFVNIYLPDSPLQYFLKGTQALIGNIKIDAVKLENYSISTSLSQDIAIIGNNIKFIEEHYSFAKTYTDMKFILERVKKFVDISKDFVAKTATFGDTGCEYCLQPSEDSSKTAINLLSEIHSYLLSQTSSFVANNKRESSQIPEGVTTTIEDDYIPEAEVIPPTIIVPGTVDKLIGSQGGLELSFATTLVFIDKNNKYPYDTQPSLSFATDISSTIITDEFNVYDITSKPEYVTTFGDVAESADDIFKIRSVALQFKTGGLPVILDCGSNNDKKFAYAQKHDLLCMSDLIYSCETDITGLTNKKSHMSTVSYGTGVYKCISSSKQQWCRQGTDTRRDDWCCNNWGSNNIFTNAFCVNDGSCDNGRDNIDGIGGDLGEKCKYPAEYSGTFNNDCKRDNGCCDPQEPGVDILGYVDEGHIQSGTECKVCRGPGYVYDDLLCPRKSCTHVAGYDWDGFPIIVNGHREQSCNQNGNCVPTGNCN